MNAQPTTVQLEEIMDTFAGANYVPTDNRFYWVFKAASRFAGVHTNNATEAALAVFKHFAPSGDESRDARRRANGYIVTSDPREMLRITLRANS